MCLFLHRYTNYMVKVEPGLVLMHQPFPPSTVQSGLGLLLFEWLIKDRLLPELTTYRLNIII